MIKIKQLLGMVFFICFYEIISLHPFDAEIFGTIYFRNFEPIRYFQFFNPHNLFFYLAPIMLVVYVFSLFRYFKENASLFWRVIAYIIISIYVFVEMVDFLLKYNSQIFLNYDLWLAIVNNQFTPIGDTNLLESGMLAVIFVGILSNWLSRILLVLFIIMMIIVPIISYLSFRKQIKTNTRISEEIKDHTNISKKIFFVKPMNLIFIKKRLKFYKKFDKKKIYNKDPSYFQGKIKSVIICFSCGLFLLLIWLLVNLFLDPVGTMSICCFGNSEIYFGYYSLWIILPFRIMQSLSFGYGVYLLINIWKKLSSFLNIEFEQSLIRDQNPNGLRNDVDKDEFDKEDN